MASTYVHARVGMYVKIHSYISLYSLVGVYACVYVCITQSHITLFMYARVNTHEYTLTLNLRSVPVGPLLEKYATWSNDPPLTLAPTARLFLAVAGEYTVKGVPEAPPWCMYAFWLVYVCLCMYLYVCVCVRALYI